MKEGTNATWLRVEIAIGLFMVVAIHISFIEFLLYECVVLLANILHFHIMMFQERKEIRKILECSCEKLTLIRNDLEDESKTHFRLNEQLLENISTMKADLHKYTKMYTH